MSLNIYCHYSICFLASYQQNPILLYLFVIYFYISESGVVLTFTVTSELVSKRSSDFSYFEGDSPNSNDLKECGIGVCY